MEDLVLSCLESRVEENRNLYARFLVGPFLKGDALTVATALRRVLLSSVESIGITALYIQGITHEFSTVAGVRESVLELSLNFGGIVLSYDKGFYQKKSFFDKLQLGYLQVQGPKVVYANDLKLPLGVKLVDPTQYIATVSKEGSLVLKFTIGKRNSYKDVGAESDFSNQTGELCTVGEIGKKNIARAKKTCSYKKGCTIKPVLFSPLRSIEQRSKVLPVQESDTDNTRLPKSTKLRFVNSFVLVNNECKINLCSSLSQKDMGSPRTSTVFLQGLSKDQKLVLLRQIKGQACQVGNFDRRALTRGGFFLQSLKSKAKKGDINMWWTKDFAPFFRAVHKSKAKSRKQNNFLPRLGLQNSVLYAKPSLNNIDHPFPIKDRLHESFTDHFGDAKGLPFLTKENAEQALFVPTQRLTTGQKSLPHLYKSSYKSILTSLSTNRRLVRRFVSRAFLLAYRASCLYNIQIRNLYFVSNVSGDTSTNLFTKRSFVPVRSFIPVRGFVQQRFVRGKTRFPFAFATRKLEAKLLRCFGPYKQKYNSKTRPSLCSSKNKANTKKNKVKANFFCKQGFSCRQKKYLTTENLETKLKFLNNSNGFRSNMCLRNVIPLDLRLTPVLKVNFVVEIDDQVLDLRQKIRERIILEVWTNGSVHPRQAVHDASLRLLDMFASFRSVYQVASA